MQKACWRRSVAILAADNKLEVQVNKLLKNTAAVLPLQTQTNQQTPQTLGNFQMGTGTRAHYSYCGLADMLTSFKRHCTDDHDEHVDFKSKMPT